jgi:Flp pilus assembly protein TadD
VSNLRRFADPWRPERDEGASMLHTPLKLLAMVVLTIGTVTSAAWARDGVRITIPAHSQLTPVQRLNREGVEAVKKRDYAKAESLFYKAYLYDPADPFTLNNLGFISELQGQLDRAHKFYELASEQGSNADIDVSNVKTLEGRPMKIAFESLQDSPMRVNRINVNAMRLLSEGRGFDAVSLLKQALALDPHNPFTLNNLGVAEEAIGDYQSALRNYGEVSTLRSNETVMVTPDQSWSGKPVSEMAASNAERLEREMQKAGPHESEAAMFNMRGVLSVNQNDWKSAKQAFLHAYALDPGNAFSLNNRGFIAELEGDLESAQYFYEKAQKAGDANTAVGLATQSSAQGKSLFSVAADSNRKVDGALDRYSQERRRETGPIELTPRENPDAGGTTATPKQNPSPQGQSPAPPASSPQLPH